MKNDVFDRRTFLKGAVAGSAAVVIGALPQPAPAQQDAPAPAQQNAPAPAQRGAPAPASMSAGYQLPLTPADLYRAGIAAANAHCVKTYGKNFAKITESQREEFLLGLQTGKVTFENGPPARVFFTTMYQTVMEGMFSDPIYSGNRNKAGWKIIGFPGVIAVHYQNVEKFRDKKYTADPLIIADMS